MNELIKKCPNCGASIGHNYNHKCPYCRTDLYITNEEIKKINNVDLKIEEVIFEKNIQFHSMIITIYAMSIPKAQWYEEGIEEIVISGDSYGKRIAYRILIPLDLYYENYFKGNFVNIVKIIQNSLPPVFDERNRFIIYDKVMKKLYQEREY